MFIAMNRFKINLGFEEGFEKIWRERESHLEEVPGYQSFALLKGDTETTRVARTMCLSRRTLN